MENRNNAPDCSCKDGYEKDGWDCVEEEKMSAGAIIGIIIACIVGLILIVFTVYYFKKKNL